MTPLLRDREREPAVVRPIASPRSEAQLDERARLMLPWELGRLAEPISELWNGRAWGVGPAVASVLLAARAEAATCSSRCRSTGTAAQTELVSQPIARPGALLRRVASENAQQRRPKRSESASETAREAPRARRGRARSISMRGSARCSAPTSPLWRRRRWLRIRVARTRRRCASTWCGWRAPGRRRSARLRGGARLGGAATIAASCRVG